MPTTRTAAVTGVEGNSVPPERREMPVSRGIAMGSAERHPVRDRHEEMGPFSASRDGKRLNMLGLNAAAARETASLIS